MAEAMGEVLKAATVADTMEEVLKAAAVVETMAEVLKATAVVETMEEVLKADTMGENIEADILEGNIVVDTEEDITEGIIGAGIMKETIMRETTIIMAEGITMGFTAIAPIITHSLTMAITPTPITHIQSIIMDTIQPNRIMA